MKAGCRWEGRVSCIATRTGPALTALGGSRCRRDRAMEPALPTRLYAHRRIWPPAIMPSPAARRTMHAGDARRTGSSLTSQHGLFCSRSAWRRRGPRCHVLPAADVGGLTAAGCVGVDPVSVAATTAARVGADTRQLRNGTRQRCRLLLRGTSRAPAQGSSAGIASGRRPARWVQGCSTQAQL
jgi:hypothetical protein